MKKQDSLAAHARHAKQIVPKNPHFTMVKWRNKKRKAQSLASNGLDQLKPARTDNIEPSRFRNLDEDDRADVSVTETASSTEATPNPPPTGSESGKKEEASQDGTAATPSALQLQPGVKFITETRNPVSMHTLPSQDVGEVFTFGVSAKRTTVEDEPEEIDRSEQCLEPQIDGDSYSGGGARRRQYDNVLPANYGRFQIGDVYNTVVNNVHSSTLAGVWRDGGIGFNLSLSPASVDKRLSGSYTARENRSRYTEKKRPVVGPRNSCAHHRPVS